MPRRAELLDSVAELEVGGAGELVEAVEVATGALDRLERLGDLADGVDGGLVVLVRIGHAGDLPAACLLHAAARFC